MGKSLIPSCFPINWRCYSNITLIFWNDGSTKILSKSKKHIAGEIMCEFPDQMVSHADSLFIGHQIHSLAMDEELIPGQTYFILPIDRFACKTLTTSSLSIFSSNSKDGKSNPTIDFTSISSPPPFEYFQGFDGRLLIKVSQDFIIRLIRNDNGDKQDYSNDCENNNRNNDICDTLELKKHSRRIKRSKLVAEARDNLGA